MGILISSGRLMVWFRGDYTLCAKVLLSISEVIHLEDPLVLAALTGLYLSAVFIESSGSCSTEFPYLSHFVV